MYFDAQHPTCFNYTPGTLTLDCICLCKLIKEQNILLFKLARCVFLFSLSFCIKNLFVSRSRVKTKASFGSFDKLSYVVRCETIKMQLETDDCQSAAIGDRHVENQKMFPFTNQSPEGRWIKVVYYNFSEVFTNKSEVAQKISYLKENWVLDYKRVKEQDFFWR